MSTEANPSCLNDVASTRVDKQTALALLNEHREALGVASTECMMCAVCRDLGADVVFETPYAQVRLDRFACTPGHLLVVPRKHVEHTTELTWDEYQHLHELAYRACAALSAELTPKRVFVASLGSSKTLAQSFPHFHIHVVPVFTDDESARPAHVLSWSSGVTIYAPQHAAALTRRIARAFGNTRDFGSNPGESDMAKQTAANVKPLSVSRAETQVLAVAGNLRKPNGGLRRWFAAALSLVAPSACGAGNSEPYVVPSPTAAQAPSTAAQSASAPNSSGELLIDPFQNGGVTVHPTLPNALQENSAKPVVTGTLLVTNDGSLAFASDVDRHVIFQVNLADRSVTRFDLGSDDEPGQLVEVSNDASTRTLFAVLRGKGAVLKLDPASGQRAEIDVCVAPRGITYDGASNHVYVACETGELVTIDPDSASVERTVLVAPDLRDVQVFGDSLIVSRYRSAEVLVLDQAGVVVSQAIPDWSPECAQSAVMHRLVARDSGVYMTHQIGTTGTLSTEGGGYAADSCGAGPMEPVLVVATDVTQLTGGPAVLTHLPEPTLSPSQETVPSLGAEGTPAAPNLAFGFMRRAGPVDLAVSPSGRIATSFTGDSLWPGANAVVAMTVTNEVDGYVNWSMDSHATTGMLTAVAFDANENWIAQSREPAQLLFEDGSVVPLDATSAANTGLDLFYVNTGLGLSCAGCHPEGDEDGRTWAFPQGLRRTQALGGGIMARAPFHWDGEMPEMNTLVSEVMLNRMGFTTPVTTDQVALFGRWMDKIPRSPARLTTIAEATNPAVDRGRVLFNDATVGCATCHSGTALTDNKAYDVGTGGLYFTPTLLGIGLRNRFMHDGCATTLHERFGLCGGGDAHGRTSQLEAAQIDDLVTYMETL